MARCRRDNVAAPARCCVLWVVVVAAPTFGAVVGTNAHVSTTVQELIDGEPASVNAADAEFLADSRELPLRASATLTSTDLRGSLISLGQGFSEFADPTRLDQPNPEEFFLEVGCYSNAESVSYSVESEVVENRTVLFARPGNPRAPTEISFARGPVRQVESRVFLSGAVVLWSADGTVGLDELWAELTVTVSRGDGLTTLFETTLTVNGVDPTPAAGGPIRSHRVDLDELTQQGLDDASLAVLQRIEREGSLVVVVIPPQMHTYRYAVTADEELTLGARMELRARNASGGTGVAAVVGRPFQELAAFIEKGLPGVDGQVVQRTLNKATTHRSFDAVSPPDVAQAIPLPRLCGSAGVGMIGLLLAVGLVRPAIHRISLIRNTSPGMIQRR